MLSAREILGLATFVTSFVVAASTAELVRWEGATPLHNVIHYGAITVACLTFVTEIVLYMRKPSPKLVPIRRADHPREKRTTNNDTH